MSLHLAQVNIALRAFVFASRTHLDVLRRRRDWFDRLGESHLALWWVAAGQVANIEEAEERLALLHAVGPSPRAFTFREHFPPPDRSDSELVQDDRELCPAGRGATSDDVERRSRNLAAG